MKPSQHKPESEATAESAESVESVESVETPENAAPESAEAAPAAAPKGKMRKVRRGANVTFMVHPYLGIEFRGEIETVPLDDSWIDSQLAAGKLVLC